MLVGGELHTSAAVLQEKEPSAPVEQGDVWTSKPFWTLWKTENLWSSQGIKPNFLCWPVRRLLIIPNTPNSGLTIFPPNIAVFPLRSICLLSFQPFLRFSSGGCHHQYFPCISLVRCPSYISSLSYISLIEVHETLLLKVSNTTTTTTTFFFLWRFGPTPAMASSFLKFLDHTQRRATFGRTPLDE